MFKPDGISAVGLVDRLIQAAEHRSWMMIGCGKRNGKQGKNLVFIFATVHDAKHRVRAPNHGVADFLLSILQKIKLRSHL